MECRVSETEEGIVNFLTQTKEGIISPTICKKIFISYREKIMTKEQRQRRKKERRNKRIKNRKPNKLLQSMSPENFAHHPYRFDGKPSIPKTSKELCEMNEINSEEDLYKNIYFLDWTYEGQTIWDEGKGESIPHGFGKEVFTKVSSIYDGISSQEQEMSYEGGFKNNKRDGYGIVTLNTGSTWEGSFKDGLRHGKGYANFKSANNFISSGRDLIESRDEFVNGRQVGDIEMVYEDGATSIIPLNEFTTFKDTYYTSSQQELEEGREYGELCVQ